MLQQDAVYALYAARLAGLYRSDDDGASWQQISEAAGETVNAVQSAAYPPEVFALLDDCMLVAAEAVWKRHDLPFSAGKLATTLLPHPISAGVVLVGFADGDILQMRFR